MRIKFICGNDDIRLSEELKLHVSRKLYKNIKSSKAIIYVNGTPKEGYMLINKGDEVELDYERKKEISWPIYESKLDVRFENDDYLVVYKRAGLLSIPTMSEPKSIYQEILYYLKEKGLPLSVSILNRLDKDTRGLMVIAKNRLAAYHLQPTHLKMERKYLCMVHGILEKKSGRIENYIIKDENSNKRYITDDNINGKLAISNYRVIKEYGDKSLLEFQLETGRTHQIRVHTKSLGHPIIGDRLYGIADEADELYLESYYVRFNDYKSNEEIIVSIDGDFSE